MNCQRIFRTSLILLAGCAPLLWDQPPARAGAADREAYYYRQKSWVPIEFSGKVKKIKQVPLADSGKEHTVVLLEPEKGKGRGTYGRPVDLGTNREFKRLSKGDHIMIWGNTARINEMPVVLADAAQINDGKTIEISRDPAFEKGHIWGTPLRDKDVYEYQNIDMDWTQRGGDSWYFDEYEYVGRSYQTYPPGASAPWARSEEQWEQRKQRHPERFRKQDQQARSEDRYQDDERLYREERRDQRMDRNRRTMGAASKSDQQLKRDVENELMWSPSVDPDKVSVSVRDGIVTLNGQVDKPEQIDSVIENAYDAGARQVISKLTTKG
ncbi:BON domain-containing protein [Nitrospira moscoviensis]|uniref:BON domain-containing protein n=1 Tax=Nitrospira moscoviensis TaxID=42253 RepID=A0A0K2GDG8_NITMO|nr:BON domain-containing protein [Nitrospira moscoviensis]ALA58993.1 exported protein of unknown function [Nitrospira moscoviensis]